MISTFSASPLSSRRRFLGIVRMLCVAMGLAAAVSAKASIIEVEVNAMLDTDGNYFINFNADEDDLSSNSTEFRSTPLLFFFKNHRLTSSTWMQTHWLRAHKADCDGGSC